MQRTCVWNCCTEWIWNEMDDELRERLLLKIIYYYLTKRTNGVTFPIMTVYTLFECIIIEFL